MISFRAVITFVALLLIPAVAVAVAHVLFPSLSLTLTIFVVFVGFFILNKIVAAGIKAMNTYYD